MRIKTCLILSDHVGCTVTWNNYDITQKWCEKLHSLYICIRIQFKLFNSIIEQFPTLTLNCDKGNNSSVNPVQRPMTDTGALWNIRGLNVINVRSICMYINTWMYVWMDTHFHPYPVEPNWCYWFWFQSACVQHWCPVSTGQTSHAWWDRSLLSLWTRPGLLYWSYVEESLLTETSWCMYMYSLYTYTYWRSTFFTDKMSCIHVT